MKKLTIVGMMVVACFTQAMKDDKKKTYSAVVRGAMPKKLTRETQSDIQQIMSLDQAYTYGYRQDFKREVVVFDTAIGSKIIFTSTGECALRDKHGQIMWQSQNVPSAAFFSTLKEIYNQLTPPVEKAKKDIRRSQGRRRALSPLDSHIIAAVAAQHAQSIAASGASLAPVSEEVQSILQLPTVAFSDDLLALPPHTTVSNPRKPKQRPVMVRQEEDLIIVTQPEAASSAAHTSDSSSSSSPAEVSQAPAAPQAQEVSIAPQPPKDNSGWFSGWWS